MHLFSVKAGQPWKVAPQWGLCMIWEVMWQEVQKFSKCTMCHMVGHLSIPYNARLQLLDTFYPYITFNIMISMLLFLDIWILCGRECNLTFKTEKRKVLRNLALFIGSALLQDERLNLPLKYLNIWHVWTAVKVRLWRQFGTCYYTDRTLIRVFEQPKRPGG